MDKKKEIKECDHEFISGSVGYDEQGRIIAAMKCVNCGFMEMDRC